MTRPVLVRLRQLEQRLDATFSRAAALHKAVGPGEQINSDVAKYLCILLSAFLEQALLAIVEEGLLLDARGKKKAERFIGARLPKRLSPQPGSILDLLDQCDFAWHTNTRQYIEDNGLEVRLKGLVDLRNQIAHTDYGGAITYSQMDEYRVPVKEMVTFVRKTVLG